MKKLIAVLTALTTLALCSCAEKSDITSAASQEAEDLTASTTLSEVQTQEYLCAEKGEWANILPDEFPPLPKSAKNIESSEGSSSKSSYKSHWVRLKFSCPEQDFYIFANQITAAGYTGGVVNIPTGGMYFDEGYTGVWQNDKNSIVINNVKDDEKNRKLFTLDIIDHSDIKPSALEAYFPLPDSVLLDEGLLTVADSDGNTVNKNNSYPLDTENRWSWDMKKSSGYYGFSMEDFNAYVQALEDAGFSGTIYSRTVDTCPCLTLDVVAEKNGVRYGVFMLYNQLLKSLEIIYTNAPELYGQ